MSALLSGYITLEKLEAIVATVKAKQAKGFNFTASVNDDTNNYGQNVTLFAEQSKEDREAQKTKWYFGNGKVFWNDGKIENAKKKEDLPATSAPELPDTSGLPF